MIEISNNLFIGNIIDLSKFSLENDAIVHATQTIHYDIMGWDRKYTKPTKNHPNYIVWERENRISLNWVDGPAYLYEWSGPSTFVRVLDFIEKWIVDRNVLIHCDQGISRSPTLGLLFLAKRQMSIPNSSFSIARIEFQKIYPLYQPAGIGDYVDQHWNEIR